ncbi:pantoate--beta-alanine ligase [Paenibacillus melissococcoides]|uniref:Pantothenate synthetase n=1 Tax=Paenibacillus melissococcoides TaxID=2912268 RepID=A0ABN8UDW0_9BACL|nr:MULTISPECIES: pantoate--beta-alanine ligase [Paenibacillus]MEB9896320.1 pantoate--beta-alanine ligase [Bacillus cereus]GIO76776.1 pantoate--beta-alanine ligase [Paenibacillus dendritiformis]CAH8249289.1 pantoate--beta-alanine ligase [Paenibacillus melissococcoides]
MIAVRTIAELRSEVRRLRQEADQQSGRAEVGFVPTMGYLHEGHASLMRQAKEQCAVTVLSIFVNPIQFGPNEDLAQYPRDEERDLKLAASLGIDIVFLPSPEEMYPQPTKTTKTTIHVREVTERLCGASRPGHFDGVTTVVAKLFHIVKPDRAYFGMKDAQQVAVIQQMVADLNFDVTIVPCPIVREADGLALSSRNVYLSGEEREQALGLSRSLRMAEEWLGQEPGLTAEEVKSRIRQVIGEAPLADIDYIDILTFPALQALPSDEPVGHAGSDVLIALAVRFGRTRLIDNRLFSRQGGRLCSVK